MDLADMIFVLQLINAFITFLLVGITGWYAWSTSRMLKAIRDQVEAVKRQSALMMKATQISAWVGLQEAAGHPPDFNPIPKLRELIKELYEMEAQMK